MYGYGYPYGFYFDWTYLLIIAGAILCMAASAKVKSTFRRYSATRSRSGLTGADVARRILQYAGITDVIVQPVSGELTDHYDPKKKIVSLSEQVYHSASIAAIGVAAHECGHAIQHNRDYAPLNWRSALVPVVNIGSKLSWPLILIGILLGGLAGTGISAVIVHIGIFMFSFAVLFQLVTLPVEFNASSRALKLLDTTKVLGTDEVGIARKVLKAAAMTYVAGAASSILQLLRLIILFGGRRRDD